MKTPTEYERLVTVDNRKRSLRELEAAVLNGETVDPAELLAARQAVQAEEHLARLQAQREANLAKQAKIDAAAGRINKAQADLRKLSTAGITHLEDLRRSISDAVVAYFVASNERDAEIERIRSIVNDELTSPTEDYNPPQLYRSERGASIGGVEAAKTDAIYEIEKAVAKAIGKFYPAYPAALRFPNEEV